MSTISDFNYFDQTPDWLEALLDEPYSQSASISIDLWLWYISQEFEGLKP